MFSVTETTYFKVGVQPFMRILSVDYIHSSGYGGFDVSWGKVQQSKCHQTATVVAVGSHQMSKHDNLSKGSTQISSCHTHQTRHRCSRSAAAWGARRCPGSTESSCFHPAQRCHPKPTLCGLWAERMAALWASPERSGNGNTGGSWGPTPCTSPLLGLKHTQNTDTQSSIC